MSKYESFSAPKGTRLEIFKIEANLEKSSDLVKILNFRSADCCSFLGWNRLAILTAFASGLEPKTSGMRICSLTPKKSWLDSADCNI